MALYTTPAVRRLDERAAETEARLKVVARGRQIDTQQPQWNLPNGRVEPLSRQERELVIRWQFLVGGATTIREFSLIASSDANNVMAEAYLRLDEEIGPVCITFGDSENAIVFADGDNHVLTAKEKTAVDRFIDAVDSYRAAVQSGA
jgi:hypothetical protein